MIKKKAKSKSGRKSGKTTKKRSKKKSNKELNPAEIRKEIAAMVEAEAGELAGAVIEEGKKGQLSTVKYLFEVAHIFPETLEQAQPTADEDSLAKTLLDRLNIPDDPVVHDLYERGEDVVVIQPSQNVENDEQNEELAKAE